MKRQRLLRLLLEALRQRAVGEERMDLSVVIVSWNCKGELLDCLESVADGAQEIIVVDNASSDGTVEAVRLRFLAVRVLETGANLGFARAANRGWRSARGEYILFLNPDTRVFDGAIAQALAYLRARSNVGILGVKLLNPDSSLQLSCQSFLSLTRLLRDNLLHLRSSQSVGNQPDGEPCEVDWLFGAFLLMPRRVLEDVGGFDEDYFMYGEDMDLCYRVRQRGYKVVYYPGVAVVHYGNRSGELQWGERRAAEIVRAEILFGRKHYGRAWEILFRSCGAMAFLAKAGYYQLLRKDAMRSFRYWEMTKVCSSGG